MPATLTYPGVYIQEVPSGVRAITGVATSVTAFIGATARGPVSEATTIHSYAEYERGFGGLSLASTLSYAVRDYFLNGGSTAIIVRLFSPNDGTAAASLTGTGISLLAASPGSWGAKLTAVIDNNNITDAVAKNINPAFAQADVFNLTITDTATQSVELYRSLTVKESSRRADKIINAQSNLVQWDPTVVLLPSVTVPSAGTISAAGGTDSKLLVYKDDFSPTGALDKKIGLYALEQVDLFNLLCIPPFKGGATSPPTIADMIDVDPDLVTEAAQYCEKRRAMLILDPPSAWKKKSDVLSKTGGIDGTPDPVGTSSKNSALFFPRLSQPNPLHDNQFETFVPSGAVAGVMARTDATRGVWKAPAGLDATLVAVPDLAVSLTDDENGDLNIVGVNCLRFLPPSGRVVWGSRTRQGDDRNPSEWKYIPVRRTALFLEESLYRGTKWVVFEPNDEPLWAQIRLNIGSFMHQLFRQGAFQGKTPAEAYLVKCDRETTTQDDINLGIVNIIVGFAPLKPAEFVVLKIQQLAGQLAA